MGSKGPEIWTPTSSGVTPVSLSLTRVEDDLMMQGLSLFPPENWVSESRHFYHAQLRVREKLRMRCAQPRYCRGSSALRAACPNNVAIVFVAVKLAVGGMPRLRRLPLVLLLVAAASAAAGEARGPPIDSTSPNAYIWSW